MFLALALLFTMEILTGSGTGPPNVASFIPVLSRELDFQIDDYTTCFVGRVVVYQNPDDSNDFIRVYYRQVAICSERAKQKSSSESGSRDSNLSNLNYFRKQESEAIGRVQQSTDAFAYVQWQTVRDSRTGQSIQDGFFKSWLLDQNGSWTIASGYNLNTSPFSEPSKSNPNKRIIVGIKFDLAGGNHIVRIDQDDILSLVKEVVNDKK
ncbi:MAG TPA: hypothetical protein VJC06_01230 [Candidatus Paceibacterota bacterium]